MELTIIHGIIAVAYVIIYYMGRNVGYHRGMSEGPNYMQDQITIESLRAEKADLHNQLCRNIEATRQLTCSMNRHYESHRRPGDPRPDHMREMRL